MFCQFKFSTKLKIHFVLQWWWVLYSDDSTFPIIEKGVLTLAVMITLKNLKHEFDSLTLKMILCVLLWNGRAKWIVSFYWNCNSCQKVLEGRDLRSQWFQIFILKENQVIRWTKLYSRLFSYFVSSCQGEGHFPLCSCIHGGIICNPIWFPALSKYSFKLCCDH